MQNMKKKSLKQNFLWTFVGNSILSLTQFGILIVLAKVGTPTVVGEYSLALAISSPIFIFFNLKLRSAQATDKNNEYSFSDYYSLRTIANIFAMATIIVILFLSDYSLHMSLIILLISVLKLLESKSDIMFGYLQKIERMDLVSISIMLRGMVSLIFGAIIYFIFNSLIIMVTSMIIIRFIILVFYDLPCIKGLGVNEIKVKVNNIIAKLFFLTLPLGLSVVLGSLNTNLPRIFLENYSGSYDLGIFAGISYLLIAFSTIVNALGQVSTPRLAYYYNKSKPQEFKKLILKLMFISLALGVTGIVVVNFAGELILTILYSKEYAEYNNVFMIIMFGALFLYSSIFIGTALTAMRRFKVQFPIHLVSFTVILICSSLFIPRYGIVGAGWVIFAGNVASFISYFSVYIIITLKNKRGLKNDYKIN